MSKSGRTEYIGGVKSPNRWRIYNKKAEMHEKNKKKAKLLHDIPPKHELTRIELSMIPKCKLFNLTAQTNAFANLTVSSFNNLKGTKDSCWELFLDSCRLRGAQAALWKVKDSQYHTLYKSRLKDGQADWWNPEKIWSQLPSILTNIANISIPEDHAA